jgi:hypothetical protein
VRFANSLLSLLLAAALAAAGIVVAVEIALAGLGDSYWLLPWPNWYRWALDHTWTVAPVVVAGWALVVVGLILLFFALAPYRPVTLEARPYSPDVVSLVRRAALERSLGRAAQAIDGIVGAGVKISRHSVRIKARSNRRDVVGLRDDVVRTVGARLDTLHLVQPPRLRVQVVARSR